MTHRPTALLGIDAGTTAVKTSVLAADGRELSVARAPLSVDRPCGDHAEQSMHGLWRTVAGTVRTALESAGDVEPAAVGVTGQGDGAWLLDEEYAPVGPAVLWLDGRAAARVTEWERDGRADAVRRATASSLFPGALPVLLEELDCRRPELTARARHQANCKDWVRLQLTGVLETDASEASRTYLDVRRGGYSTELIEALGHQRFAGLLPPIAPAGAHRPLLPEPARALGLPAGIPVVTGLVDTAAAGVGLGVLDHGRSYAVVGTTAFLGTVRAAAADLRTEVGITIALGDRGSVLECLCPMTGTPNLDWVRTVLGREASGWDEIEAAAREVPAGAGGVLYLPYAAEAGERAPFSDVHASASWLGLSARTTAAQLLRAVYEGVAFSLRECQEALGVEGRIRLCGGAATSGLLCQILADVTSCTVERAQATELGARGVAALAHTAASPGLDLRAAAENLLGEVDTFSPSPRTAALYDAQFRTFTDVRDAIRPHWPQLRNLRRDPGEHPGDRPGDQPDGTGTGTGPDNEQELPR